MNKTNKGIIKGYKGIMDLDLSLVPDKFIKIAIDQHEKDIKEYALYQSSLKPQFQYENTVERIQKQEEYSLEKQRQRNFREDEARYKKMEIYNNSKNK